MSIEILNPANNADVDAVAALHETYLAGSPVVKMGKQFLRRFYYSKLVEDGSLGCSLCRADGRVVGFISYTARPRDFMARGLRRHFFFLSWLMFASVLVRPALVKDILFALKMMGARAHESSAAELGTAEEATAGEALSLAIVPEFERYIPPGGRSRLPLRLFESAVARLGEQGVDRVAAAVQPSNVGANLFYSAMGCTFEKIDVAGVSVHRYTYHRKGRSGDPAPGASA